MFRTFPVFWCLMLVNNCTCKLFPVSLTYLFRVNHSQFPYLFRYILTLFVYWLQLLISSNRNLTGFNKKKFEKKKKRKRRKQRKKRVQGRGGESWNTGVSSGACKWRQSWKHSWLLCTCICVLLAHISLIIQWSSPVPSYGMKIRPHSACQCTCQFDPSLRKTNSISVLSHLPTHSVFQISRTVRIRFDTEVDALLAM